MTANVTVTIFTGMVYWAGVLRGVALPLTWMNYTIPANFYVGNITSKSGVYKLGFQVNWQFYFFTGKPAIVPVLLVDSERPGVYDTVYVDVSSVYKSVYLGKEPDYSFADERPYHKGDVVAEDYTGDGIPDISLGVVGGYFLDNLLLFGGGFKEGFTETGDYLLLFYDFYGHGTACACAIASDGSLPFDVYGENRSISLVGVAKDVNILPIQALFNGFVEAGWFFAAGFDTMVVTGPNGEKLPVLYYTGRPRADLTSNSWGISYYWYDIGVFGADFVSILEDALSVPGYLDPRYPGLLMVQAGGNGGPGYGTITSPGASTLALTVGASTCFHWVKMHSKRFPKIFFDKTGYYDNVIFWSLRGPTPIGEVKPDVVNVGAFGWVPASIAWGRGDGSRSYWLFGGTSFATPLTAGVAALVIQALRSVNASYTPQTLKALIMNTAVDLNYPAFIQGAGRVDAYNAVKAVLEGSLKAYSPDSWINVLKSGFLLGSWYIYFGGRPVAFIPVYPPAAPYPPVAALISGSAFEGYILPGESKTGVLMLENSYGEPVIATIRDYRLVKVESFYLNFTSVLTPEEWVPVDKGVYGGVVYLKVFDPEEFKDADFVVIQLYFDYSHFDPANSYEWATYHGLVFGEWEDADGDGQIDVGEFYRMNYAYSRANVQELTLNNPYAMMRDPAKNKLVLYVYRVTKMPYDVPVVVKVTKYAKADSPYVSLPATVPVPAGAKVPVPITVSVPEDAKPGIYWAMIEITTPKGDLITFPVSWSVPYVAESTEFAIGGLEPSDETPYDQYSTCGRQQWEWRYESGDWRFFHILLPKRPEFASVRLMEVTVEWRHPDSGFDFYVHNQFGLLIGLSEPFGMFYLGRGRVIWHTTLNRTALRYYAVPIGTLSDHGMYILAIRNYQYGGLVPAEPFRVKVKLYSGIVAAIKPGVSIVKYVVPASRESPIYSIEYMLGPYAAYFPYLSSVITVVVPITGPVSVYTLPSKLPHYAYSDLRVLVIFIRSSPAVKAYVYHLVMGFRPMPLYIRMYNMFMPLKFYYLDAYEVIGLAL